MATPEELVRWEQLGGQVETLKGRKTYVSSSGKRLRTWKEAARCMEQAEALTVSGTVNQQQAGDANKQEQQAEQGADAAVGNARKRQKKGDQKHTDKENAAAGAAPADAAPAPANVEPRTTPPTSQPLPADGARQSRREATQNISYKEAKIERKDECKGEKVVTEAKAKSERDAIAATQLSDAVDAAGGCKRRLTGFDVIDAAGQRTPMQHINLSGCGECFITGAVYPSSGAMSKDKGRAVQKVGPVTKYSVSYLLSEPSVVLHTAAAEYACVKPSSEYRPAFSDLMEQVGLCFHILQGLKADADATFERMLAHLSRSKAMKGYVSVAHGVLLSGPFIMSQLPAMQAAAGAKLTLESCAFVRELTAKLNQGPPPSLAQQRSQGIEIREAGSGGSGDEAAVPQSMQLDSTAAADEEFARRLQGKLDAQNMAAEQRGGHKARKGDKAAYIKISEEEIADDYPMPKQYVKEREEMDELLVNGDDMMLMDVDPDNLPKQVIDNFAAYNGDGFLASLELLPMWQHVDPDVELFGSGIVSEQESEWAAGHPFEAHGPGVDELDAASGPPEGASSSAGAGSSGAGGSGGGSGAAGDDEPAGMPVFLSEVKEWMVEYSCDMLFISVRTDCAWYQIRSVAKSYQPWFDTVLKSARLAVHVLAVLDQEKRISRLSFSDVVKMLAEQPVDMPTFISAKLPEVERFVVVHGQIILNQFKHFPKKAVQTCAFVTGLKRLMEARRHSKLYMSKAKGKGAAAKGRRANPMKDRSVAGRPKPMTATATNLVKAVWMDYFKSGKENDASENAAKAEAVEEDENEEDEADDDVDEAVEDALQATARAPSKAALSKTRVKASKKGPAVEGVAVSERIADAAAAKKPSQGAAMFRCVTVRGVEARVGSVIELEDEDAPGAEGALPLIGLLQAVWHSGEAADAQLQVRVMVRGIETVLGDAASAHELFLTARLYECPASSMLGTCRAHHLQVPTGSGSERVQAQAAIQALLAVNKPLEEAGKAPVQLLYRSLYIPEEGLFKTIPSDLELGAYLQDAPDLEGLVQGASASKFVYEGQQYCVGDFVYIHPSAAASDRDEDGDEDDDEVEEPAPKAKAAKKAKAKASSSKAAAADEADAPGAATPSSRPSRRCATAVASYADDAADDAAAAGADARGKKKARPAAKAKPAKRGDADEGEGGQAEREADGDEAAEPVPAWLTKYKRGAGVGKGDLTGLQAYVIGQIESIVVADAKKGKGKGKASGPTVSAIRVRCFARPEDVSREAAYEQSLWSVYATADKLTVDVDDLRGRCCVTLADGARAGPYEDTASPYDVYKCIGSLGAGRAVGPKPASLEVKGGAKQPRLQQAPAAAPKPFVYDGIALKTLDIFAGCGGLSEGMHQARAAVTKWAIEYERPAADAFKLNNPDAVVYAANCNVILHRAMAKAGQSDQCEACDAAVAESSALDEALVASLPAPGEVEFICGGPPCQGYSGMNRFNKGNWSMVQNSMVMSYLSYCDFYRPRYWLLENVRNFVSHNKSFTFRLTLRTLLEMGYQVRFGVLNAGNFGVSQSRKRTFIWAAAPSEELPEWPRPLHVFKSPQLCINLPGGISYRAVKDGKFAPLRAVTVRDAIRDLPAISNGEETLEREYAADAVSDFQKYVRGDERVLRDHICKTMNALNVKRCSLIPRNVPGADWRALVLYENEHGEDALFEGQRLVPWCLPNTADRHNGWRGLFGRLDWNGHFPTAVTDPNPMGKVGQVFHPEQDRIVSVRECARAQGFPDRFRFSGTVQHRHKQVGNAVPPPLARALGCMLRKKLDAKASEAADNAFNNL